ncbi:forkhead box protein O-like [Actinia tenebrosa]|uniref:Forkhead box protein O-like n=1 Tax=Actinia tenebrosa TaxID=6105 RepID=A0A6P8IYK0_ACTTE|nr:forkhead box protein O-like [Actinia tenebrosa]
MQNRRRVGESRKKMYEIPPSVDWYLRVSSKSRIHYPAVYEESSNLGGSESSYSSSKDKEKSPKQPAQSGLNSPELERRYSPSDLTRKRKFEEFEDDLGRKRPKKLDQLNSINCQARTYPHRNLESCLSRPTTELKSIISLQQQRAITQEQPRGQNKEDFQKIQELVKKFPEIRPKTNEESNLVYKPHNNSTRKNPWGGESYSDLIASAIRSFPNNRATLQQIYEWIVGNVPHFADKADYPSTKGWKNAIRHTLSIRKRFTRIINDTSPHSSLWTFSKYSYKTTKY